MADPKPLTRDQLAKFLPNERAIRAFEKLFEVVPTDIVALQEAVTALQETVDSAALESGDAQATANEALALLQQLVDVLQRLEFAPLVESEIIPDDLRPMPALGTMSEQDADNVAVKGGAITAALTNNTNRLIDSSINMFDGTAALVGTLNNAPKVGNPTKWLAVNDNGTIRYVPAW